MKWPTAVHEALNDADSLLSLVYYRGLGALTGQAGKADIHAALTVVRAAEAAVEGGGLVVVERGRLLDMLADSFRAGVAEEADVVAMGSVNERADEIAHAFLARLTEQQP